MTKVIEDLFSDIKTARAVVNYENKGAIVYSDFVKANGVNVDNYKQFKSALGLLAFPDLKPSDLPRKSFESKVYKGLQRALGITGSKVARPVATRVLTKFARDLVSEGMTPDDFWVTICEELEAAGIEFVE